MVMFIPTSIQSMIFHEKYMDEHFLYDYTYRSISSCYLVRFDEPTKKR
jgi:hypothetical protein